MANEQNLIPLNKRTQRERKEIAAKGAEATNKARREKKNATQVARAILDEIIQAKDGEEITIRYAILRKAAKNALKGDIKALKELIRIADEMPKQQLDVTTDGKPLDRVIEIVVDK